MRSPQRSPLKMARPESPLKHKPTGDSIRVAVRVRPVTETENSLVEVVKNQITIVPPSSTTTAKEKSFAFDTCFHKETNEQIYESFARDFLDHGFNGYNSCILAYGQTSSGKSHTMMGSTTDAGIISRSCRDIFERIIAITGKDTTVTVRISFCEIYNEQIIDLLRDNSTKLRIKDGPDGPFVDGLCELIVKSPEQALKHLADGCHRRATAATKMNNVSSRSHAVFSWQIRQMTTTENGTEEVISRLRLVDLAGSERANATGAVGERFKEGANINKSLVTLGRIISALATLDPTKKAVIPYRESVLTRLLQDSLGGNSKTAMIACISPASFEQSLGTLRYADQAKRIKTSARVNQELTSAADADAKVEQMQKELAALQERLSNQEEGPKITKAMRFLEEQASALEAKCKWYETHYKAARTHNELMSGYLREQQSGPLSANFSQVQAQSMESMTLAYASVGQTLSKWQSLVGSV